MAIARALVGEPEIVFADEPTGALDIRAGREVLALLRDTVDAGGRTLVMVTHDPVAPPRGPTASCSWPTAGSRASCTRPTAEQVAERLTALGE